MNNFKILHTENEIVPFVNNYIRQDMPLFLGRIGGVEYETAAEYYVNPERFNDRDWYMSRLNKLKEMNGYFDFNEDPENFRKFIINLISYYKSADLLMYGGKIVNQFDRVYYRRKGFKADNSIFLPYILENKTTINWNVLLEDMQPFLKSFKTWGDNKKILIISPFSKSVEYQYQNKDRLFLNYTFPTFELKTYNTKITYNSVLDTKESLGLTTNNWHEQCELMAREIKDIDFDIAFLACSSYAMFLGNYIKNNLNKKSIYLGGTLNLLFNIFGTRYIDTYKKIGCDTSSQIEAFENDDIKHIHGGRSYANESLQAYFGLKTI